MYVKMKSVLPAGVDTYVGHDTVMCRVYFKILGWGGVGGWGGGAIVQYTDCTNGLVWRHPTKAIKIRIYIFSVP